MDWYSCPFNSLSCADNPESDGQPNFVLQLPGYKPEGFLLFNTTHSVTGEEGEDNWKKLKLNIILPIF